MYIGIRIVDAAKKKCWLEHTRWTLSSSIETEKQGGSKDVTLKFSLK